MKKIRKTELAVRAVGQITEIRYSLDVKLSKDYNSAGTKIGMTASIEKGQSPKRTVKMLKKEVEKHVKFQVKELADFLSELASKRENI